MAQGGVGAAIAAGSHAEKGIWALLVMAAKNTHQSKFPDCLENRFTFS